MLQNIPLRGHNDSAKNDAELAESDVTNFGNLAEVLWHRVEGVNINLEERGNKNLESHECPMFCCFSLDFFLFVFVLFQGKL